VTTSKEGKWVDRLAAVRRRWTLIFKGSRARALAAAPNIYAARRRRGLKVEIRRSGGTIEARRAS
jgi:hypothetical protein